MAISLAVGLLALAGLLNTLVVAVPALTGMGAPHWDPHARGTILGVTLYGRGWGHGVGMCQVGAYGMAMEGATFEEILKKYYKGIELRTLY